MDSLFLIPPPEEKPGSSNETPHDQQRRRFRERHDDAKLKRDPAAVDRAVPCRISLLVPRKRNAKNLVFLFLRYSENTKEDFTRFIAVPLPATKKAAEALIDTMERLGWHVVTDSKQAEENNMAPPGIAPWNTRNPDDSLMCALEEISGEPQTTTERRLKAGIYRHVRLDDYPHHLLKTLPANALPGRTENDA